PPGTSLSTNDRTGAGSQASVALGSAGGGIASHETMASAGTPEICGAKSSTTVTTCTATDSLSHASTAVHVRVRILSAAQSPGASLSTNERMGAGSQASLADGWAGGGMASQGTTTSPGT